ncbi:MAG TPA: transcriptional repressor [Puia sp.]|nr:transcriptional repressor [Puia sp.]
MNGDVLDILKKYGLHITEARVNLLALFTSENNGLTHAEIEKLLGGQASRVTIYRTLQTFVKTGILHCVPTANSLILYALGKIDHPGNATPPDHAHFICESCGRTWCLEKIQVPPVELARGFVITKRDLILKGKCNHCKE